MAAKQRKRRGYTTSLLRVVERLPQDCLAACQRLGALPFWFFCLVFFSLPLAMLIYWHTQAHYYPRNDSANYIATAQYLIEKLKFASPKTQVLDWLKPLIHQLFLVPFLLVTNGKILTAIALSNLIYFSLFFIFTALLLREFTTKIYASVVALLICTVGWVFGSAQIAMAEMPHIAAIVATLYFLKKAEFFKHPKPSMIFGALFGLTFCIRPVESVTVLPLPLLLCIREGYLRKHLSKAALKLSTAPIGAMFLIIALPVFVGQNPSGFWIFLGVVSIGATQFFIHKHSLKLNASSKGYVVATIFACTLMALWFFPMANFLYGWVYGSSLGDAAARIADRRSGISITDFWSLLFSRIAAIPLWVTGALALLKAWFAMLGKSKPFNASSVPFARILLYASLFAALFILSFSALSANNDLRYYFPAITLILLSLAIIAYSPNRTYLALAYPALLVAVFFNLGVWVNGLELHSPRVPWFYQADMGGPPVGSPLSRGSPLWRDPDPLVEFITSLKAELPKEWKKVLLIPPQQMPGTFSDILGEEPLRILAQELNLSLDFGTISYDSLPTTKTEVLKALESQLKPFNYAILGPLLPIENAATPQSAVAYYNLLLSLYEENHLEEAGMTFLKKLSLRDNNRVGHDILLLKIK